MISKEKPAQYIIACATDFSSISDSCYGQTFWGIIASFKNSFMTSSFGKTLKMTVFMSFTHLVGLIFLFSFIFYFYIFLLAHTAFVKHTQKTLHIIKKLDQSIHLILAMASIPLARPSIIVGTSLMLMEVLADCGSNYIFLNNERTSCDTNFLYLSV
jgi:iron(III) transport system permease protein